MSRKKLELVDASDRLVESVEGLHSFQLAYRLSLQLHQLSLELPKHEQYELASQMRRSSKSICANLTEGFAKQQFSKAEFKRFLAIAIGSATEVRLWLQYAVDLKYIPADQAKLMRDEYESVLKMLQKLHAKIV